MTRTLYFVGGLIALTLIFVTQSVVVALAPDAGAAAHVEAVDVVTPAASDPTVVAIDDLAAWPPGQPPGAELRPRGTLLEVDR